MIFYKTMDTNTHGHKILRTEGQFNLCEDTSAGYSVFYLENYILTKYTLGKGISYGFEEDKKAELMIADRSRFVKVAKQAAGNDINCEEVAKKLWSEFELISIDEEGRLEDNFFTHTRIMFDRGTYKTEVLEWFEMVFGAWVVKNFIKLP